MRWSPLVALLVVPLAAGCGATDRTGVEPPATAVVGKPVRWLGVPGAGSVLVTRQDHPRGGYQVRLYAADGARRVELVDQDHNPAVPFIARDTGATTLVDVDCAPRELIVTEAEPSGRPHRGERQWRVHRTTYPMTADVAGLHRTSAQSTVSEERLRTEYPDLFTRRRFSHCVAVQR